LEGERRVDILDAQISQVGTLVEAAQGLVVADGVVGILKASVSDDAYTIVRRSSGVCVVSSQELDDLAPRDFLAMVLLDAFQAQLSPSAADFASRVDQLVAGLVSHVPEDDAIVRSQLEGILPRVLLKALKLDRSLLHPDVQAHGGDTLLLLGAVEQLVRDLESERRTLRERQLERNRRLEQGLWGGMELFCEENVNFSLMHEAAMIDGLALLAAQQSQDDRDEDLEMAGYKQFDCNFFITGQHYARGTQMHKRTILSLPPAARQLRRENLSLRLPKGVGSLAYDGGHEISNKDVKQVVKSVGQGQAPRRVDSMDYSLANVQGLQRSLEMGSSAEELVDADPTCEKDAFNAPSRGPNHRICGRRTEVVATLRAIFRKRLFARFHEPDVQTTPRNLYSTKLNVLRTGVWGVRPWGVRPEPKRAQLVAPDRRITTKTHELPCGASALGLHFGACCALWHIGPPPQHDRTL
jgi:hypothetical protein